jgi:putative transposase
MPRRPREIIPGIPYHVTHRGNHRDAILATEAERAMYVSIMARWQEDSGILIAAFVIMPNHVHFIVVAPTEEAISRWIANGHRDYSRWLNTVKGRRGHNWEERFFAVAMDEGHCLNALRYIERNPVAAGLAATPWAWHWSSAGWHAGTGPRPGLLNHDLRPAGTTPAAWRAALLQPAAPEFRAKLHECRRGGFALGSEEWAAALERAHGVSLRRRKPGPRPATADANGRTAIRGATTDARAIQPA